jgi:hypothetical protein
MAKLPFPDSNGILIQPPSQKRTRFVVEASSFHRPTPDERNSSFLNHFSCRIIFLNVHTASERQLNSLKVSE